MVCFVLSSPIAFTALRPHRQTQITSRRLSTFTPLTTSRPILIPYRSRRTQPEARMVRVSVPILVEAPLDVCYRLFSDLSLMPEWSSTLKSVQRDPTDPRYSDWSFAWNGIQLSWRAKDSDPEPDQPETPSVRWHSVSGLNHTGRVDFEPQGDQSTTLTMTVDYDIASLLAVVMESSIVSNFVQSAIEADLQRFRGYALRCFRKQRIQARKTIS